MKLISAVIAALVLLFGALFATTWWTGEQTRSSVSSEMEAFAEGFALAAPSGASVTQASYQRGLFSSSALYRVEIPGQVEFGIRHDMKHGPLIMDANNQLHVAENLTTTRLDLPEPIASELYELFGSDPLTVDTLVTLDGGFESRLVVPTYQGNQQGAEIDWKGVDGRLNYNNSGQQLDMELSVPGLEVSHPLGSLSMGAILASGSYDTQLAENTFQQSHLWQGRGEFTIASLTARGGAQTLSFSGLKSSSDQAVEAGTLDVNTQMSLDEFQFGNQRFTDAVLDITMANLSVEAIEEMQRLSATDPMMMGEEWRALANDLLAASPAIAINDLRVTTNFGLIEGRLKVAYDGAMPANLDNPLMMVMGVGVDGHFQLPSPYLRQLLEQQEQTALLEMGFSPIEAQLNAVGNVTQRLDDLTAQGLLESDGDNYRVTFSFKQGQLNLNGKSANQLLGALMMGG